MRKFNIKVDGIMHEVEVEEINTDNSSSASFVTNEVLNEPKQIKVSDTSKGNTNSIVAPLQGTVQTIKVKVGDTVKVGDVVVVIEAMKMENDIPANVSGTVKEIHVSTGMKVASGDTLIDIA